jgi:hypothetical protein
MTYRDRYYKSHFPATFYLMSLVGLDKQLDRMHSIGTIKPGSTERGERGQKCPAGKATPDSNRNEGLR